MLAVLETPGHREETARAYRERHPDRTGVLNELLVVLAQPKPSRTSPPLRSIKLSGRGPLPLIPRPSVAHQLSEMCRTSVDGSHTHWSALGRWNGVTGLPSEAFPARYQEAVMPPRPSAITVEIASTISQDQNLGPGLTASAATGAASCSASPDCASRQT